MKGMRKFLFMMALAMLVTTLATVASWAQTPAERFVANRTRLVDNGSKIFPSGSVQEPGSQLLYLVDFGARTLDASARPVNFLSVTNVHNTQAVTVHVRYFSSVDCRDILDFLVVLTPNDVWQFNPFEIIIPRPDGTSTGITASSLLLDPARASIYGDGRFLIFISASGAFHPFPASGNSDNSLNIVRDPTSSAVSCSMPPFPDVAGRQVGNVLFPNSVYQKCSAFGGRSALPGFDGVSNGLGGIKTSTGIDESLNILTAKNISFNYLIGSQTLATGPLTDGTRRSFGLAAWARPAVVFDHSTSATVTVVPTNSAGGSLVTYTVFYDGDGDGLQAEFRVILSGQEAVPDVIPDVTGNSSTQTVVTNDNFLRSEIQNGFYLPFLVSSVASDATGSTVTTRIGWRVKGGALAWDRVFPTDEAEVAGASPDKQVLNFISVEDDYNGSKNVAANVNDRAASLHSATTLLATQVYDNTENPLSQVVPDVIISPPPPVSITNRLAVVCINVFLADDNLVLGTNFGDLTLRDLYNLTPSGASRTVQQHLAGPFADPPQGTPGPPVYNTDLSAGWMRFNRLRQEIPTTASAFNNESPARSIGGQTPAFPSAALISITETHNASGTFIGTGAGAPPSSSTRVAQHSYVLLGRYNIQFRELGAAYWMHGVSDEETGIGDPFVSVD